MLSKIKKLFVLILFPCLILSCKFAQDEKGQNQEETNSTSNKSTELSLEQASAFDALTTLQVSTDEKNRLYSTFAGITQPCYPPDTSFVLTRSELLTAMKQFAKENLTRLNIEERDKLINSSVLAQKEYTVLHCGDNSTIGNYETGLPMKGTWIMPSVLDRRDVILVW